MAKTFKNAFHLLTSALHRIKTISYLFMALLIFSLLVVNLPCSHSSSLDLITNSPLTKIRPEDKCDSAICKSLLDLIDGAKQSIDFAIYGMRNQTQILSALRNAKERGVAIRGIVDMDVNKENPYTSTDELMRTIKTIKTDYSHDLKVQEIKKNEKYPPPRCKRPEGFQGPLQCLSYDLGDRLLVAAHASREPLKFKGYIMHNKFFIIDGRYIWTGSANISDSGIGGYNANMVAVIDSSEVASWYKREFEQMYQGDFHRSKESNIKYTELHTTIEDSKVRVFFSPQDDVMERSVLPLLQDAKESIDITMFFLTHKRITGDLIKAHRRGVKVRVILDATGASNGYTKHELLRVAGIPVKVENWGGKMHMKAAVIDKRYVIAGSMNWTAAGERDNDENTVIIEDPTLAIRVSKFFKELWKSIPNRWLEGRPDPESRDSGTSCRDGKDNDFDGHIDADDPGCGSSPPSLPKLPPYRIVQKSDQKNESSFSPQGDNFRIIPWQDAPNHYGETCTVEGKIVDVVKRKKVGYLNFHKNWETTFSAVIFAKQFSKFPTNLKEHYEDKKVRVMGTIQKNERYNKPEIVLESPDQIQIIN